MKSSTGDSYNRNFIGDLAQCGCHWTREPEYGDVLRLCQFHQQVNDASVREFERERKARRGG